MLNDIDRSDPPENIKDLDAFLVRFISLLKVVGQCRRVLFIKRFRDDLPNTLSEALEKLEKQRKGELINPKLYDKIESVGLNGDQLKLKINSFNFSSEVFDQTGSVADLKDAIGKGSILLKSLAGAIPGFGSLAQELIDFIEKEMTKP